VWDAHLPADPRRSRTGDRLFDFAVTVSGCTTPWIALNELFGAQTPTPWTRPPRSTGEHARSRQAARERGAKPFVTIANPPYTGGDAAQWWRTSPPSPS
jgi:hypothetical protein